MHDIELPIISLCRFLLAPVVVLFALAACLSVYEVPFDDAYLFLAVLAATLSAQFLNDLHFDAELNQGFLRHAGEVFMRWLIVLSILAIVGYAAKISSTFSRLAILTWVLLSPLLVLMVEAAFSRVIRGLPGASKVRKALVVGAGSMGKRLVQEIDGNRVLGIRCLGLFDDRSRNRLGALQYPLIGTMQEVASYVKMHGVNTIFITLPMSAQPRMQRLLGELRDTTASIYFVPDLEVFDLIQARAASFRGMHLISICESPFLGLNGVIKRCVDVALASLAALLLLPVMLFAAIGIKLSSNGPVIFRQRRYGLDGKEIIIYKFRTMNVMEDGKDVPQATRNDNRLFPFGAFLRKTSLDELPQLLNVIEGSMSLVGPRPHAVAHNELYRSKIPGYMVRHKVKPGITGWAQVHGLRGEADTVEKMKDRIDLDLDYLRNWSLTLDLAILVRTVPLIFRDPRAY